MRQPRTPEQHQSLEGVPVKDPGQFPPLVNTEETPSLGPQPESGKRITGFSRDKSQLSNSARCSFIVKEDIYGSVDEYVATQKAKAAGDDEALVTIARAHCNTNKIETIEGRIKWPTGNDDWCKKSLPQLTLEGNLAKYEQEAECREAVFRTAGTDLAFCSKNTYWGIGIGIKDETWRDRDLWTGHNKLGNLLTEAREQLMADPKYAAEIGQLGVQRSRKRSLSRDPNISPIQKHPAK